MTHAADDLVASTATSQLGILHLQRYWAKMMAIRQGRLAGDTLEEEHALDTALLAVLGLGLEPTLQYLFQVAPSFPEFEAWIQRTSGRVIDHRGIDTFNARLLGVDKPVEEALSSELVLSADDLKHWDAYGYVVIKQAITQQDCDKTIQLICDFLAIKRNDPQTWYSAHPSKQGIMIQLFQHAQLTKNRESPRIRGAYEQLWGRTDLWVNTDRVGFNPPQTDQWPFPGPRLHWDVRLDRPVPFGLQGLLYLSDTRADQGAFTLVPAFQHKLASWLAQLGPQADPQRQDLEALEPMPIAGSAGDFIIWHHALPHGSSPNTADVPRFVQYINYAP